MIRQLRRGPIITLQSMRCEVTNNTRTNSQCGNILCGAGIKSLPVIICLISLLLFGCASKEEYAVKRKDLVRGVYASGQVLPVRFYEVTSKMPGIVDSIYVSVGQNVNAGDVLLKIQAEVNLLNSQTAKNLYEQAKKNASENSDRLKTLRQRIDVSYATYQQDSLDYTRYESLNKQNIGSEQEFEIARLRYQTSKTNYNIAKTDFRETYDKLQVELKTTKNNYLSQESMLGDYVLVATISGRVYDIKPAQGEYVSTNHPVIDLGSSDSFEVEMLVDETDIILIGRGQSVVYQMDAVDDTVFYGTVREIYPRINPDDKTARVVATIEPMGYDLYPGMSLEANIIIEEKKNILVVPVEYLSMDETVVVKKGSGKETVKVRTGIRDLKYAEILSGLNENDQLIKQ